MPMRRHNRSTSHGVCASTRTMRLWRSTLLLLLLAVSVVVLLPAVHAAPIRIALSRQATDPTRIQTDPESGAVVAQQEQRPNASEPLSLRGRELRSITKGKRVSLKNYGNVQYIGKVAFGNPQQELDVVFDTGSSDTWIPGADCEVCGSHNRFEYPLSTTFLDTQEKFYDTVRPPPPFCIGQLCLLACLTRLD